MLAFLATNREVARSAAAGVRAVLAGQFTEFVIDYPCHSRNERRWFNLRVTRMSCDGPVRAVLSHENITNVKLTEQVILEREECSGQEKLATVLCSNQNNRSDSFGVRPPL